MCNHCFCDNKRETETSLTVEVDSSLILIRHIPCLKCNRCGEVTITDKTSKKIETLINRTKARMAEFTIVSFEKEV